MRNGKSVLLVFLVLSFAWTNRTGTQNGDRTADIRHALEEGGARNVLLFIGDGMGDSEVTLARNYVTDSAASGTGWSTGVKTSNGRISTSARTDRDLKTILEIAQER